MVDFQAVRFCIGTCTDFVCLRGGVERDRQGCALRECVACLSRRKPLWLRVGADEVEIRIGGVLFRITGWRLLRLEMVEDPPTAKIIHVIP